jgi:hypothetical protein
MTVLHDSFVCHLQQKGENLAVLLKTTTKDELQIAT